MIHTADRSPLIALLVLNLAVPATAQKPVQGKPQAASAKGVMGEIVAKLRRLESSLIGLQLEMETEGAYPSGQRFTTRGRLRVLRWTHEEEEEPKEAKPKEAKPKEAKPKEAKHSSDAEGAAATSRVESLFYTDVTSSFGEVESHFQQLITDDGVWVREFGPLGEAFTVMSRRLMSRLRVATAAIAKQDGGARASSVGLSGPGESQGKAPLGSAMLVSLSRQFALEVQDSKHTIRGESCRLISGDWHGLADDKNAGARSSANRAVDRVQIFISPGGIPIEIKQFKKQVEVLRISITKVEIDKIGVGDDGKKAKDAEWFRDPKLRLRLPDGREFLDVQEHPPSKAQIQRILDDYRAIQNERQKPGNKDRKGSKDGKGGAVPKQP